MRARDIDTKITRRSFLATSAGAGLVMGLGVVLPGCSREQAVDEMAADGASLSFSPAVWFEVDGNGKVLVNIAKAEMGQHVGTALARIVADELGANWDDVSIDHVDSDPKWGYMVTGGSWSVFTTFTMLSQAGAAGRTILRDAGAALLGASPDDATVENGMVSANGESVSFAEIVRRGDISRTFSDEELGAMPVKAPSERTLIGKPTQALDVPAKSGGDAQYGIDAELDGMVFAHPLIPPTRYGSTIRSIDDTAAKDIRGYIQTLALEDPSEVLQGWAVVIAENYPAAMKAARAVEVDWEAGPTAAVSEADLIAEGQRLVTDKTTGVLAVDDGDVGAAQENAADTHTATYTTSTALHFTLEPANALVEFRDGKCHIHSGNQWQSLILPTLATALQMEETDIVIHQ
ncbi:MAG: molybdopterin-dependent oxidoreductase, partial [Gammaproteobacteria bacterium]|nr:molybdopterin-dependent oxidoreductase [Gammaproteobacteria bacterium]